MKTNTPTAKRQNDSEHTYGWRDFFDVVVRWRQVSEPNDAVWWIDRLPTKAFNEGFGLQTPIVNGQLKTIRYYPYFPKAFDQLKKQLKHGFYNITGVKETLNHDKLKLLSTVTTLEDVYALTGKDFFLVLPCYSVSRPGVTFEGTRLTLVRLCVYIYVYTHVS